MYKDNEVFERCGKCGRIGAFKIFNAATNKVEMTCLYCKGKSKRRGWPNADRKRK